MLLIMRARKVPGHDLEYALVGEGYFHGMTTRDAMEKYRNDGLDLQSVFLV